MKYTKTVLKNLSKSQLIQIVLDLQPNELCDKINNYNPFGVIADGTRGMIRGE